MNRKDALILGYLLTHKNEELNILQLSKGVHMDYKNVSIIIRRLENEALVKLESFGGSYRIRILSSVHPLLFEAEFLRKKTVLKNKNIAVLLGYFEKLSSRYYTLLLFGSHANGTPTRQSDIDLLFIVPSGKEDAFEKEVSSIVHLLPFEIHFFVFSEKDFLDMVHSKDLTVGKEAFKNNVILYGIETYYELVGT